MWTIAYKPFKGFPDVETRVRAADAHEAWQQFGIWRQIARLPDYYQAQAYQTT